VEVRPGGEFGKDRVGRGEERRGEGVGFAFLLEVTRGAVGVQ